MVRVSLLLISAEVNLSFHSDPESEICATQLSVYSTFVMPASIRLHNGTAICKKRVRWSSLYMDVYVE